MAKIHLMGTALIAAALVAGCSKNTETAVESTANALDPNEAMITIGDKKLTRGDIERDVNRYIEAQGDKIPAEQIAYAKQMIGNQVAQSFLVANILVSKAKELGYSVTDEDRKKREEEFAKMMANRPGAPKTIEEAAAKSPLGKERAMEEFNNSIIIEKMIETEVTAKNTKDYSADAKKQIAEIKARNDKLPGLEAEAKKKIEELKVVLDGTAEADKSKKFGELAKENSACPSGQRNGDLGEFTRGQMVKEFDEAAFTLPVGKISDVIKTDFGYHLILVTKKIPEVKAEGDKPAEPEKVQASHILIKTPKAENVPAEEELAKMLKKRDEGQLVNKFIVDLIRKAEVKTAEEYKHMLPPEEEPAAEAEAEKVPVEEPAKK